MLGQFSLPAAPWLSCEQQRRALPPVSRQAREEGAVVRVNRGLILSIGKKSNEPRTLPEFFRFSTSRLMKTRIVELRQSLGQPPPKSCTCPRPERKNFKIRTNKLLDAGIMKCRQGLGRCAFRPSRGPRQRGYTPQSDARGL